MKNFIFFLFFLILSQKTNAGDIFCNFEEVYSDGSVQNGLMILKKGGLRYEYNDQQLFTIFYKKNEFFLVNNQNVKNFQKISNNTDVLMELMSLYASYPDIPDKYDKDNISIVLEKSKDKIFYKRVSIISENLQLSIYFNNCKYDNFPKRYYNYSPYFKFSN